MLVLSRKSGESIRIGRNITVKVVQCRGNRVRLGIEAPTNVEILREETADWREQWEDSRAQTEAELELALT